VEKNPFSARERKEYFRRTGSIPVQPENARSAPADNSKRKTRNPKLKPPAVYGSGTCGSTSAS
jgi:hypothetical protein